MRPAARVPSGSAGVSPPAAADPDSVSLAPLPGSAGASSPRKPSAQPPTFESLLESVGAFGRYQQALCVGLIGSSTFVCALTYYTQVLVLLAPPLRCRDGAGGGGQPAGDGAGGGGQPAGDVCGGGSAQPAGDGSVTTCSSWTYDTDQFFATITSENDWVCADAWRPFVIHAVFWVGNIFGSWIWGNISDRLGRRPATLASFVLYSVFGGLTLLRPSSMAALATVRFLVGTAHHTISHLPYMLVIEYCGASARVYPLLALIGSWSLGGALLPWIAYLVWDWRILMLLSSLPLLLTVAFYRYIPESSSWLMVHNRGEDAAVLLRRIAAVNGRSLDEDAFGEVLVDMTVQDPDDKKAQSLLLVRKHPWLLKNMILAIILWMISCLCFYGHTQNTGNLGGSVFSSFSLGSTTELMAMAVPFVINALGRKWPMALFFVSSGTCGMTYALLQGVLPPGVQLTLGLMGRMLIMGAYSTCLQYGPELFPTVVRGQSLALYETLGGVAIFISPSIVYLHEQSPGLPLLVIGAMSLLGGALTILLPETAGANLPQTLLDGDMLGRGSSLLSCHRRKAAVGDNDMESCEKKETAK